MVCENHNDPEDTDRLGEIITDALITDLMESQYIKVVSLQHLYDILKQMGIPGQKKIKKSEQIEVAKRANAARIIYTSIGRLGSNYILTAQCIDVKGGEVLHSIDIPGSEESFYSMVDSVSVYIKSNLDLPQEARIEQDRPIMEVTTASYDAYRYYLIGQELKAKYHMNEAAEAFEKAVSLDSTFATAYSQLAAVYLFLRQDKKKRFALEKAFENINSVKEREWFHIYYQRASELKDKEGAKEILFKWIDRYPDDKLARFNLGYLYSYSFSMYDEAIFQYKRAIDLDNEYGYGKAYNYLGYAYARKGMEEEAVAAIQKYVSLRPDVVNPYDSLGEIYMNLIGNYKEAEKAFLKALQIKSDFSPNKLAELYLLKGQYHKAEIILRNILYKKVILPISIKYFLLARLYYEKEEFDKALDLIREGKGFKPSCANLYWISGLVHLKKNRLQEAEQELEQLKTMDPDNKNIYHLSGNIYLAKKDYKKAIRALKKPCQMIPYISWFSYEHRESYKQSLAEAYIQKGDLNKALGECQNIIADNPNWARVYYLLGQIYEQKGENVRAVDAYNKFLNSWPEADRDLPTIIRASQRIESLK